jgi:hypothetical protein
VAIEFNRTKHDSNVCRLHRSLYIVRSIPHFACGEFLERADMFGGQLLPGRQIAYRNVLEAVVDGQRTRVVGQAQAAFGDAEQVADEKRLALGCCHQHLASGPVSGQVAEFDLLVDALAEILVDEERVGGVDVRRVDGLTPVAGHALGARVQAVAYVDVHEVVPGDERELA